MEAPNYYLPENITKTSFRTSPSGKYAVIINTYNTSKISGKNTWEYTQGEVYFGDRLVGSIRRNYCEFPFLFFQRGDHEWFISGSSYMNQTVIDCSTGEIYDRNKDEFCWAKIYQLDENTLAVEGCYWGAGYETQFFDFTDPSKGWPELDVEKLCIKYL